MVVIRLTRGGSHKRPFYHIVATESASRGTAFHRAISFSIQLRVRRELIYG